MVNTILKEADLFCPNSVRINFTIYPFNTLSFNSNGEYVTFCWQNTLKLSSRFINDFSNVLYFLENLILN
ncbi:hypothetical protein EQG69_09160 [Levilactobacillus brevis]|nr:hypothetical protein EQG69_09160 [Levilactobacillus brevis]